MKVLIDEHEVELPAMGPNDICLGLGSGIPAGLSLQTWLRRRELERAERNEQKFRRELSDGV